MLRGRGGVFEGWLAVGHCVEYLMQVSPVTPGANPEESAGAFAAVQPGGEDT